MSSLSREFLTTIARKYVLSPEQEEVLVELYGGDGDELEVADELKISHSALRTRLTGIYSKFSIGGKGPGKFYRLQKFLLEQQQTSGAVPEVGTNVDIRTLVKACRQQVKSFIQECCSTMRVLDMEQPIGLGEIYTNVNILENLTGRRRLDMAELLENFNPEEFDRLGLGPVTQSRVPGLEAVQRYNKLMVLGKPGAGKTTFLKYLAIQCSEGAFQADCVPIFITLKTFAEAQKQPDLLTFILWMLTDVSVADLSAILQSGRALLLLDGLDEVRQEDASRVLRAIQSVADRYPTNQFVITCRIAAQDYTFQNFTDVEVADFDEQQIAEFSTKWFRLKHPTKAERFIAKLKANKRIQELATNPLLLTLLCLVFEEKGKFKDSRAELYEEGIELLLEKWDDSRDIERDPVYKKLSINRKEDLLSHVAFTTFAQSEYFFKRKRLEQPISDYIQNIPGVQTDPEALLVSSRKVLRSIEAQHGLLVERARNIYSFSHLTFQEYFTARNIIASRNPNILEQALQGLVVNITEKRWREVFLLTAEMLPEADYLLELMKAQVDSLLAGDEQLQTFLMWGSEKSISVDVTYKPAAVRAFYLALALALALALDLARALARDLARARALDLDLDLARALALALDRALARASEPALKQALHALKEQLPDFKRDVGALKQWWRENGNAWTAELRAVMIEHRNIGHDWQFSDGQRKKLEQYYEANKLLVDCLNSDCYVTRAVREKIESTLLLPIPT
ncbi:NACHT domain-containing NTPase [Leptothoe sp. PORK10 BA2]|uniref:NACHT domain-containing NTPase n=1 Tax=Leptothoe sp. PORK10 BA2 TaxID=3110254 RepID=UPI002B1FED82|nr:NACHT domain-containing NTPase [Leptothoe sp. PORK10 BA2]MEA5464885.1 NACHT domain-containing NTPase [Leptothoe sp. PORK10 BA2]